MNELVEIYVMIWY